MSVSIQRVKPGDVKLNLLVYGLPGVGKTTLALQANDHQGMAPALVLNLEGGLLSVAARGDVDEIPIHTTAEFEESLTLLAAKDPAFAKYKTVIIDSGSELAKKSTAEWTARNTARAIKRGKGDPDRTADDIQLEDYGKMTAQMRRLFSMARDMPIHTIVTSLVKFNYPTKADGTKGSEPSEVVPDFTAGLQMSVMGMFDMVWYMYQNQDRARFLMTQTMGAYRAKTRGEHFADAIIAGHKDGKPIIPDPNLPFIYDALLQTEGAVNQTPNPGAERVYTRKELEEITREEIETVKAGNQPFAPSEPPLSRAQYDDMSEADALRMQAQDSAPTELIGANA